MAITPIEIAVLAVVVIIFVMWGPKKIPELARALGRARKEFSEGAKDAQTPPDASGAAQPESTDDTLLETARKLGITTEGKTAEQISQEIVSKANKSS
ncbi:MAG: twin-arginine translocase TatA/TatE family subunit [Thaumarchaeota archaeon]|nr:twin-arginine translocase TatA/TatE family subunit [Nitrososphaerota archaeon]MCS4539357.1 twin-arginine translocase TatA/TatE family subunit [Nitrososphaerota archaeon]